MIACTNSFILGFMGILSHTGLTSAVGAWAVGGQEEGVV
jgi:hypothetical protein